MCVDKWFLRNLKEKEFNNYIGQKCNLFNPFGPCTDWTIIDKLIFHYLNV